MPDALNASTSIYILYFENPNRQKHIEVCLGDQREIAADDNVKKELLQHAWSTHCTSLHLSYVATLDDTGIASNSLIVFECEGHSAREKNLVFPFEICEDFPL